MSAPTAQPFGLVNDIGDITGADTATFSVCRNYRYALTRSWDTTPGRRAVWVMLNPSTADAFQLDPTLKRCRSFAQAWGCRAMTILNLFALRATDPKVMLAHPEPVGRHNDDVIRMVAAAEPDALWVAGWGPPGKHLGRGAAVAGLLAGIGVQLHTVRVTTGGFPGHPLYVPAVAPLTPWRCAAAP